MDTTTSLMLASFMTLLAVLAVDLYFSRCTKTVFMTNQGHVNLYIIPFLLSFVLFTLAISGDGMTPISIAMLLIFLGVYIYILSYDKIILMGAVMEDVLEEVDRYLKDSGRTYRIYVSSDLTRTVDINNYHNAMVIRDAEKWIEIDNHIHYDEEFVEALNQHFRKKAPELSKRRTVPNVFYFLLVFFILALAYQLSFFYLK